jgi:hypothetical protein
VDSTLDLPPIRGGIPDRKDAEMAKPKLSSKTPDDAERNSLVDTHDDLLKFPDTRRYAVVEFAVTDRTYPTHNDAYARVQLVHFEEVQGDALADVLKIRDRVFTDRTGYTEVPSPDTELDFADLDDDVDITTS